jgi:hypothetical protein
MAVFCVPLVLSQSAADAHGGIEIGSVGDQRSRAKGSVVVARGGVKERISTNSCVSHSSGKALKRVLPFRRGEVGIAPVRW